MSKRLLDPVAVGARIGKTAKTGRRFLDREWPGAIYLIGGKPYVYETDFEDWIAGRRIEAARSEPSSLKQMLRKISDDVLARRSA